MKRLVIELEGFSTNHHTVLRQSLNALNTQFIIYENDRIDTRELISEIDINTFLNIVSSTCAFIALVLALRQELKQENKKLSTDEADKIISELQEKIRVAILPEIKLQLKLALLSEEKPFRIDLPTDLGAYRIIVMESGYTYYLKGAILNTK